MKRQLEIAVISDVHLGTYGCHASELIQYLKSIEPNILILNGDIIDAWNFSKKYFPISHMAVIKEIMNFITKGTRVIYITGNHDEFLRRYCDLGIANFQLVDKMVLEIDGKKCWFFHGDIFDATTTGSAKIIAKLGGKGYDLLIVLNRAINWMLQLIGKEKRSFSKTIKNGVKKAVSWISDFEKTAADLAIEKKYDYVICGHIHQPQVKTYLGENGSSVTYLNSGDWVENLTSLEYYNNDWHLYQFEPNNFEKVTLDKRKVEPNVLATEIMLQFNTLKDT